MAFEEWLQEAGYTSGGSPIQPYSEFGQQANLPLGQLQEMYARSLGQIVDRPIWGTMGEPQSSYDAETGYSSNGIPDTVDFNGQAMRRIGGDYTTPTLLEGGVSPVYDQRYGWLMSLADYLPRTNSGPDNFFGIYGPAIGAAAVGGLGAFGAGAAGTGAAGGAVAGGTAGEAAAAGALTAAEIGGASSLGAGAVGGGIAGMSASELASYGWTAEQLAEAGYSASEIAQAGGAVGTGTQAGLGAAGTLATTPSFLESLFNPNLVSPSGGGSFGLSDLGGLYKSAQPYLSLASGLKGLYDSQTQKRRAQTLGRQASPFDASGSRAATNARYQELLANPSSVAARDPQFLNAIRAAARSKAPYGVDSGAFGVATSQAGTDWYNKQLELLGGLSGAGINPAAGGQLELQGLGQSSSLLSASLASLGFGVNDLAGGSDKGNAQTLQLLQLLSALQRNR